MALGLIVCLSTCKLYAIITATGRACMVTVEMGRWVMGRSDPVDPLSALHMNASNKDS